jgi:hypothetical protein
MKLLESYQSIQSQLPGASKYQRDALLRIITLYEDWNKQEKVSEYQALLAK